MAETSNENHEQRSVELKYATPDRREVIDRATNTAFICGMISIGALLAAWLVPLASTMARLVLFFLSGTCAAVAVPAGIVGLRMAAKRSGIGRKQAFTGLMLGSLTAILFVLGFVLVPALNNTENRADRIKCQSHLKIIGQSLFRYTQINKGQFPARFTQLITDCDVASYFFVCPHSTDQRAVGANTEQTLADFAKPGRCSYIYLGTGQTTPSVTKDFVLAYEPLENHEKEGAHFLFGNGRVEWLDAEEADRFIAQLKSGVNPPKK